MLVKFYQFVAYLKRFSDPKFLGHLDYGHFLQQFIMWISMIVQFKICVDQMKLQVFDSIECTNL